MNKAFVLYDKDTNYFIGAFFAPTLISAQADLDAYPFSPSQNHEFIIYLADEVPEANLELSNIEKRVYPSITKLLDHSGFGHVEKVNACDSTKSFVVTPKSVEASEADIEDELYYENLDTLIKYYTQHPAKNREALIAEIEGDYNDPQLARDVAINIYGSCTDVKASTYKVNFIDHKGRVVKSMARVSAPNSKDAAVQAEDWYTKSGQTFNYNNVVVYDEATHLPAEDISAATKLDTVPTHGELASFDNYELYEELKDRDFSDADIEKITDVLSEAIEKGEFDFFTDMMTKTNINNLYKYETFIAPYLSWISHDSNVNVSNVSVDFGWFDNYNYDEVTYAVEEAVSSCGVHVSGSDIHSLDNHDYYRSGTIDSFETVSQIDVTFEWTQDYSQSMIEEAIGDALGDLGLDYLGINFESVSI